MNFAFPRASTFSFSIAANSSGECLFSIILPISYLDFTSDLSSYLVGQQTSGLYIESLRYVGNSSVKVVSLFYGPSYASNVDIDFLSSKELFTFTAESSRYSKHFGVYGSLINFVVPPNGQLEVVYESRSHTNMSEYDFETHGAGVIQTVNYPLESSIQVRLGSLTIKFIDGLSLKFSKNAGGPTPFKKTTNLSSPIQPYINI